MNQENAFAVGASPDECAHSNMTDDSAQIVREHRPGDEFISGRLIEFVADAKAVVDETLDAVDAVDVGFPTLSAMVDKHLMRALDAELTYCRPKVHRIADANSLSSLEQFVERGGSLKEHFEAVLALHRETNPVDKRLHASLIGMIGYHSRRLGKLAIVCGLSD
jgi:hypothetical protein